jgi:hypothetical protein
MSRFEIGGVGKIEFDGVTSCDDSVVDVGEDEIPVSVPRRDHANPMVGTLRRTSDSADILDVRAVWG